ncbi:MAG: MgtC/SapB family protein [Candidatus Omnitrophica bacterium]|nr:MgtC/SapB family protein [Candidatus Omnitrophota bacterium]MCK5082891.1 MgtC/SapB family protein [Candidatus Omnitrophota bacterium]
MTEFFGIIFKVLLSILLSSIIGFERELRQKGAGLRTHILVGLGSTLIVLTSLHLFDIYKDVTDIDPTRMITGIVTGIGFLCAGTIIQAESRVRGLTTAAALWIVSGVGIAVGAGHYSAAIIVSIVVFFVLIGMRSVEHKLSKKFKNKISK